MHIYLNSYKASCYIFFQTDRRDAKLF